jgi:hypothetical protein
MVMGGVGIGSSTAVVEAIAAAAAMQPIMAVMPAAITPGRRTPTDTTLEWRMPTQPMQ